MYTDKTRTRGHCKKTRPSLSKVPACQRRTGFSLIWPLVFEASYVLSGIRKLFVERDSESLSRPLTLAVPMDPENASVASLLSLPGLFEGMSYSL